jgi:uncharacterized delta-60 repeat protein
MSRAVRVALTVLSTLLFAAGIAAAGGAVPLRLDPSFGNGGLVLSADTIPEYEAPAAIAVGPDREIVVAAENPASEGSIVVARYQHGGKLDTRFGAGAGYVPVPGVGAANALAVDADGRILLLSRRQTITRLTTSGQIDASFGEGGSVEMSQPSIGHESFHLWSLAALPDGRVVGAGISFGSPRMVAIRLLPNGELDPSFHGAGSLAVTFGRGSNSGVFQMKPLPKGKLLLGGYAENRPALALLLPDGTPDRGFGHNGRVRAPKGLHGRITALAVGRDGTILAGATGWTRHGSGTRAMLLRFNREGRIDRHFGSVAVPNSRNGQEAIPITVMRTRRHILLATRGRGTTIRAYRPNGKPVSFGQVRGVPSDHFFHIAAASQGRKLILTWASKHAPGEGGVDLARFVVR